MAVYRIDEDAHLIEQHLPVDDSTRMVNALVIQARRPVLIDTCYPVLSRDLVNDLSSVLNPAEIAFVGKAPGRYQVWLGGNVSGTRLNRVWKETLKDADIENEMRPVFARFAKERNSGERFGDWCDRAVLQPPSAAGN